ncbi:MAG: hypothetical protein F6K14_14370 [Symploca sp. SIO2C1]|nr:hypothetical protein [Symploca sp. SIO2C1]
MLNKSLNNFRVYSLYLRIGKEPQVRSRFVIYEIGAHTTSFLGFGRRASICLPYEKCDRTTSFWGFGCI